MVLPPAPSLLDRQVRLLAYLTEETAIFGAEHPAAPPDPLLQHFDRKALGLVARFSHEKRVQSIRAILPKTFEAWGSNITAIISKFARACPPTSMDRLENARQFYNFVVASSRDTPTEPAHVRDVAACELACAIARANGSRTRPASQSHPRGWIRRSLGVVLVQCSFDLRSIFEHRSPQVAPIQCHTLLSIRFPQSAAVPEMLELSQATFDLLAGMNNFTDPASIGHSSELKEILHELTRCHLIERA